MTRFVVVIERRGKLPLFVGPFATPELARDKAKKIKRGMKREHFSRNVYPLPIISGREAVRDIVAVAE
jgi:hypothetical protein